MYYLSDWWVREKNLRRKWHKIPISESDLNSTQVAGKEKKKKSNSTISQKPAVAEKHSLCCVLSKGVRIIGIFALLPSLFIRYKCVFEELN